MRIVEPENTWLFKVEDRESCPAYDMVLKSHGFSFECYGESPKYKIGIGYKAPDGILIAQDSKTIYFIELKDISDLFEDNTNISKKSPISVKYEY